MSDVVPGYVLRFFPVTKVHQSSRLLEQGIQCRLCLQSFHVGQQIKTLPCRHKVTVHSEVCIALCSVAFVDRVRTPKWKSWVKKKNSYILISIPNQDFLSLQFHSGCIKTWLQQSICCPVDWHVIYNPLTWSGNDRKAICTAPHTLSAKSDLIHQQKTELLVHGISLQSKERSDILEAVPQPSDSLECIVKNTLCIDSPQGATRSQSGSQQRTLSLEQAPVLASKKRISVKTSRSSLSLSPVVKRLGL